MINIKFFDYIVTFFLFFIFSYYFYNLDKGILLEREFFPWDSYYYKQIADGFLEKKVISTMYPFNERILFPFLVANFSNLFQTSVSVSSIIINISSTFFLTFIILFSLNFFKISNVSKIFTIILFLTSFIMPLRYSFYYPGNNYGFDMLLISLIIFFNFLQINKNHKYLFFLCLILSIVATLERGVVIVCIYLFPLCFLIFFKRNIKNKFDYKKQVYFFCSYTTLSLSTWICLKIFGLKGEGDYNMLKEVISSIQFQANIFEFFYKYYYSFGIFFFILVTYVLINTKSIILKIRSIKKLNIKNLYIFAIFFISILLSTIGGRGDVDKHLLWFILPYLTLSAILLDKLKRRRKFNTEIFIIIFIIGIIAARPFSPAWPPMGFSNIFVEKNHVNTNFADELYFGPKFLKKFKNKMSIYFIGKDKVYKNIYVENNEKFIHEVEIPSGQYFEYAKHRNYIHAYKYRLNDIPFPLGYIHNHRNALIDHPYHGHRIIRLIYILQWFLLQFFLFLYLVKFRFFKIVK